MQGRLVLLTVVVTHTQEPSTAAIDKLQGRRPHLPEVVQLIAEDGPAKGSQQSAPKVKQSR